MKGGFPDAISTTVQPNDQISAWGKEEKNVNTFNNYSPTPVYLEICVF